MVFFIFHLFVDLILFAVELEHSYLPFGYIIQAQGNELLL